MSAAPLRACSCPRDTGSTCPCNCSGFPGRKKQLNLLAWGAQKDLILPLLPITLLCQAKMLLSISQEPPDIWGSFSSPLSPITRSGQCFSACEHKNTHHMEKCYCQRSCSLWREHHSWVLRVSQSREGKEKLKLTTPAKQE